MPSLSARRKSRLVAAHQTRRSSVGAGSGGGGGGGGAFLRGAGETQLEMDRRLFGKKIQRLKREIDVVGEKRENFRRRRREREGLPLVAIIG